MRSPASALLLTLVLSACGEPSAPEALTASLAIAPELAPGTLSSPIGVDNVHLKLIRAPNEQVIDTAVVFPADSARISIVLRVPLKERSERLNLVVELRLGTVILYEASQSVQLFAEAQGPTPTPHPVVSYVGPGSTARTLRITPRDTVLSFGDSFSFRISGTDAAGAPVNSLLILWSTVPALSISNAGLLVAPVARGTVKLRAFTPAGVGDSTTVRFVPPPALLILGSGAGQTAPKGSVLAVPFVVQVRGADGLGVPGVAVHFRALTAGGQVQSAIVISDDTGSAGTSLILGGLPGIYSFDATVTGLLPIVITATAF